MSRCRSAWYSCSAAKARAWIANSPRPATCACRFPAPARWKASTSRRLPPCCWRPGARACSRRTDEKKAREIPGFFIWRRGSFLRRRDLLRFAAEIAVGVSRQVGEHRVRRDVLRQRLGIDLVERVVRRVVVVEIVGAILAQRCPCHALRCGRTDVRARAAFVRRMCYAQRSQHVGDLLHRALRVLRRATTEGIDAAGAEIAFRRDLVLADVADVPGRVGLAAVQALLLVREGDDADAARRALL